MKHASGFRWEVIVSVPLVVAAVAVGLWLAVEGAYENVRLARATDQILDTVAVARNMGLDNATPEDKATKNLLDQLERSGTMHIAAAGDMDPGAPGTRGIINPWGGFMDVKLAPSAQTLRLTTHLSPTACRRLVLFFSKTRSLGVQRVEARDDVLGVAFRQIYDASSNLNVNGPEPFAIKVGCGFSNQVMLALTFRLR
jgi:hypothetical protein